MKRSQVQNSGKRVDSKAGDSLEHVQGFVPGVNIINSTYIYTYVYTHIHDMSRYARFSVQEKKQYLV